MAQGVEHLFCKLETLSSNSSPTKKKKKEKKIFLFRTGGVAQAKSTSLANMRPWTQTQCHKKKKF
jgi:hypothetical protein